MFVQRISLQPLIELCFAGQLPEDHPRSVEYTDRQCFIIRILENGPFGLFRLLG